MRKILCLLLAAFCITCCSVAAMGESSAQQYEKAMELLKENQYTEAGRSFAALGTYADSPRYTMYCNAIAAGEAGLYSVAVENLNSLNGFLDSNLLAIYYAGLSWEAAEDYEQAREVLAGITLYRDVAARLAGYPALINARDYRKADAYEKAGKLEDALSGFLALGSYADSADRAAAVREKIKARDEAAAEQARADAYAAADRAEQNGDYDTAYTGFVKLGDYKDSAARAAVAAEKARADAYAAADRAEQSGDYATAYAGFSKLGDYKDSAARAAAVQNKGKYAQALQYAMSGDYSSAYSLFDSLGDYEDSVLKAYILSVTTFATVEDRGNGIAAFKLHDAWGILNVNDNIILSPIWDSIGRFNSLGLAKVSRNDKYGYINTQGEVTVACEWDEVSEFSGSLCTVGLNGFLGLVDSQGRIVSRVQWQTLGDSYKDYYSYYIYAPSFSDGKIKVQDSKGKWGFIDTDGKVVGEVVWDEIQDFSEGFAAVSQNKKFGFIDKDGRTVIQPKYTAVRSFHEGLAAVRDGSKWKYINLKNEAITPTLYLQAFDFSNGKASVYLSGTGWQIINKAGELIYFVNLQSIIDYKRAIELEEAGELEQAIALFSRIDYKDSAERARKLSYDLGKIKQEAQDWDGAVQAFEQAVNYSDAATQILATRYAEAETKRAAEDWDGAVASFAAAGEYSDAKTQILATRYMEGEAKRDARDWSGAVAAFASADNYSEAKEQIYNLGEILREAGNWDDAVKAFEEIGDYSDAATQITETRYQQANFLNKAGKYEKAYAIYATICGYKDVDNIVKKDANIVTARKAKLKLFKTVGSYVTFGTYPQTKGGKDKTPIEWLVLNYNAKNNRALLISRYGLDVKPYNEEYVDITWEKCTLRTWLNGDFYNRAFNDSEQSAVLLTNVDNSKNQGYSEYSISGSNNTQDRIFLLSYAEANKYFGVNSENTKAGVVATDYAIEHGAISRKYKAADDTAFGSWWLRSPGFFWNLAACVGYDNSLYSIFVHDTNCVVRPAIWLNLNADIF